MTDEHSMSKWSQFASMDLGTWHRGGSALRDPDAQRAESVKVRLSSGLIDRLCAASRRDSVSIDVIVARSLVRYLDTCDKFGGSGRLPSED